VRKIIAVTNPKGGVGKTFLAFHLACFLQQKGENVKIIDLDIIEAISVLAEVRESNAFQKLDVTIAQSSDELYSLIEKFSETHNVIIDIGGYAASLSMVAVGMSDYVIAPTSTGKTDEIGLLKLVAMLKEIKKKNKEATSKALVVINNVKNNKIENIERIVFDNPEELILCKKMLKSRVSYNFALAIGASSLEIQPKSASDKKGREEMKSFLDSLLLMFGEK